MHLNRKGYLTVDIILASVVAVSIAVFLMEITIKLVNITNDAYVDTELLTDKALIIKNIKKSISEDMKNTKINSVSCNNNTCDIAYSNNSTIPIKIENNSSINYNNTYSKKLGSSLYNIKLNYYSENGYYDFYITADNKFSKEPYRIDIIIKNNS